MTCTDALPCHKCGKSFTEPHCADPMLLTPVDSELAFHADLVADLRRELAEKSAELHALNERHGRLLGEHSFLKQRVAHLEELLRQYQPRG